MKLSQIMLESLINDEDKVETYVNVAGGVIIKEGENNESLVLLIRRAPDDHWPLRYEFPRGKCDKGSSEPLINCLKREIKEETGLDVIPLKFIDKFSYVAEKGTRKSTQYNYLCKMKDPNQPVKLSKEHDEYKWIGSVGEVELMVAPECKKTISKVLNTDIQIVNYSHGEEEKITESYLKTLNALEK